MVLFTAQYLTKKLKFLPDRSDTVIRKITMLEKVAKIEELINKVLAKVISLFCLLIRKLTPKKLSTKYFEIRSQLNSKVTIQKKKSKDNIITFSSRLKEYFLKTKTRVQFVANIDYKSELLKRVALFKDKIKSTTPKKAYTLIQSLYRPYTVQLHNWYQKQKGSHIYLGVATLAVCCLGITGVYLSFSNIYEQEFPYREPASVQEYDDKPDYAMYERKSLKILNIKIPVIPETVSSITSITLDFNLRTSTRNARFYLSEYEYKLKDHFFTNVEMISSDFPLEQEGKEVLKEKIIEELNNFLEEEGIEGVIEDVNILFMIAT